MGWGDDEGKGLGQTTGNKIVADVELACSAAAGIAGVAGVCWCLLVVPASLRRLHDLRNIAAVLFSSPLFLLLFFYFISLSLFLVARFITCKPVLKKAEQSQRLRQRGERRASPVRFGTIVKNDLSTIP